MFLDKPGVAQQLLETWPDGLIGLDHYGKIIFCNDKTCSILGWQREELVEQSAHELLCSKAADYAHSEQDCPMCCHELHDTQLLDHFEAWWVSASGVYSNLDVRVLYPDINDLDIAKILMFSECASGTVSQFEARRLSMFAEFSPVPILEIMAPMSIEFANPAMTDLMVEYGFNDDGVPNVLPVHLELLVADVFASKEMLSNQEVEYADKSFVWIFNPLRKNNKSFVQLYGIDVTELRKVQYELEEAKNIAERASDAKSYFLANMSHEIRTPMNAIVGFTEILTRSKLNDKQLGYCNKIKISSAMLLDVINDILDFSKIEAGKMILENSAFNLVEHVEVLADLFSDRAHDAGIHLVFDIDQRVPAVLLGDSLRLKQIMINLVSNALKFTAKGTIEIIVKLVRAQENQCRIRIEIKDTGKGIPKDKQAQLFAPFTQEDESTTRQFGGTGLGLSICRSLVELMGGSIGVRSQEQQGSVFFFEANLGIADPVSILNRQMKQYVVEPDHNEVILLESEPVLRRSLRRQLQAYGLTVHEFESGVALVDEQEWVQRSSSLLAVFCDDNPENMTWIETFEHSLSREGLVHPRLISMVELACAPSWSQTFAWPEALMLSFEKPLKPSIIARSVLEKGGQCSAQNRQSEQAVIVGTPQSLRGFAILIVDDNAFNRELAKELLQDTQANLFTADDGQSAVHLCQSHAFDFILMDIQMPIMDGHEATHLIKAHRPDQIVIALTANAIKGDRERFMQSGFDDYLSKPIDCTQLQDMMYFWAAKLDKSSKVSHHLKVNNKPCASAGSAQQDPLVTPLASQVLPEQSTQDFSTLPVQYKGLMIAQALKMVGDKTSLYIKLMILFRQNYADLSGQLTHSLQEKDFMTAGRLAHTIKGSAANLGAEQLRVEAYQLEASILAGTDSIQESLSTFCVQLDTTLTVMDEFIEKFQHLG